MIKYAIIGAGWRSEFYLRIANLLPNTFSVSGIYIRNSGKRLEFSKKYNVPIFDNLDDLLNTDFDFIVSCVNRDSICDTAQMLADKDIYVLTETPVSRENLNGKIQVAEQFHFMPRFQAYKSIIDSGILGEISQVQLSCCHDYHAASLIRFLLDTKHEIPKRTTIKLQDTSTRYNSRAGFIDPTAVTAEQNITVLEFENKTAVYDFNFEQYFSDIRASRVVIRGTNGEIVNNKCTYLIDGVPHKFKIMRNYIGAEENLDGFALNNITANGKVLYKNPFKYARLSDEEIAIATCLIKMHDYVQNDIEFYSAQDAYIDYKILL